MSKAINLLRQDKVFMSKVGVIPDKDLAEKYNVKISTVRMIRKETGKTAKRKHVYPKGIELYAGKMSDRQAAEILNCSLERVFSYRVDNNIEPFRKRSDVKDKSKQFIADYEEFGTLQKVADKHGVTRERVRQILINAGYTKRYYNHAAKG